MKITAFVVCVEYDDLLAITLPRNMKHLSRCVVVTTPGDALTRRVAEGVADVSIFATDAFYRGGAKFNKGLALEEAFRAVEPRGWVLVWDADTLMQERTAWPDGLRVDVLYGAQRLLLEDPAQWSPAFDWRRARQSRDRPGTGYFQLFHSQSPTIAKRPWYDTSFTHAGGGDGYFTARWSQKKWLPFKVLHLGPRDRNWMGRATRKLDGSIPEHADKRAKEMGHYLEHAPWSGKQPTLFDEHVPGQPQTGYRTGSGNLP